MNLRIGLLGKTAATEQIIRQLGCDYIIVRKAEDIDFGKINALICSGKAAEYRKSIEKFISFGGAVIFDSVAYSSFSQTRFSKAWKKHLFPETELFEFVEVLDLFSKLVIFNDADLDELDSGLKIKAKDKIIVLPFSLDEVWNNNQIIRKKFNANCDELPSERVNKSSKAAIRKLILITLEILHDKQGLPLIQKWYFPNPDKTHFIFRIDTDFCTSDQAKDLYELCVKYQIPGSWFVDTQDFSKLQNVYANFEGQEIGLHCWHHMVFDNESQNLENLKKGCDQLDKAKINYSGFVAPLGEWNENLQNAIKRCGFIYSSEFGYDYDNFPDFPMGNEDILQIPIHPISSGRLRRSHFTVERMVEYYLNVLQKNIVNSELTIFYHHPSHPHLKVFESIFEKIKMENIPTSNMKDFAKWWLKRDKTVFTASLENNEIKIDSDNEIYFRIYRNKTEAIVKPNQIFQKEFYPIKRVGEKMKNARKWCWRILLYNYETARGKKNYKKRIRKS